MPITKKWRRDWSPLVVFSIVGPRGVFWDADSFPKRPKTLYVSFPSVFFLSTSWMNSGNSVGAHQQASRIFFPTPSNHSASMLQTQCFWGSLWQDRRLIHDAIHLGPWSERRVGCWNFLVEVYWGFETIRFADENVLILKNGTLPKTNMNTQNDGPWKR